MFPRQQMVNVSLQGLEWCKEPVFWVFPVYFWHPAAVDAIEVINCEYFLLLQHRRDFKVFFGRIGHLNVLMYVPHLPDSRLPTETAAPHGFKPILVTWICLRSQKNMKISCWNCCLWEYHRFEGKPGSRGRTSRRHFVFYATDVLIF